MPKPAPRRTVPEIVTQRLMPARARDGSPVNLGAGVTDNGTIALINSAPDGIAVVTVEGASEYLGLVRTTIMEAVSEGARR